MLTGKLPFQSPTPVETRQVKNFIINITIPNILKKRLKEGKFIDSPYLNDTTKEFMREIFHPNPSQRLTINQIAKHKAIWQDKVSKLHV